MELIRLELQYILLLLSLLFLYRKQIEEKGSSLINVCVNMSIVTAGLYMVSMATSGVFLGRLPIYTSLYNYILLPWEVNNLFEEGTKKIVFALMIVLYLAFYFYQIHWTWALI